LNNMTTDQIREDYLNAVKAYYLNVMREERFLIILSILRLVTFIGGLIFIWIGFAGNILTGTLILLAVLTLFIYLLKLYWSHSENRDFLNNLVVINRNEAKAVSGDFSVFEAGNSYMDTSHDFSNDVDLFGNSSFFQYLNRTVTSYGRDILAGWLSDPYSVSPELALRQETIKELSLKEKWRHQFMATGMKKPLEKSQITDLLQWLDEKEIIKSSPFKKFMIYFLPALAITALLLLISGVLHYSYFTFIILLNLLYITSGLKKANKIHTVLSRKYIYLQSVNGLLKMFEKEPFTSVILKNIRLNISEGKVSAAVSVNKLNRLIQMFDTRMNMLLGIVLNGLLLWDYHSIYRLEKWKSEYKNLFPVWLEMLGKIDAFISLGNYAFNNPGFVYPQISVNSTVFSAKDLGHQIIDKRKRVCNDFKIEHLGTVCIISGANMAGKSTFLRTVAVNYIVGMVGAPVCAKEMNFTPSQLFTSMRTTDSLSNNESYFYAELKRLKTLKSRVEKGEPLLFILDEILKGTNSADKSLGSKLFLKRLVELGGTGLIATHDISLGEMENDYPEMIVNKCFEIEIEGESIRFDYKIQNGKALKMNAVFLMNQMGILD